MPEQPQESSSPIEDPVEDREAGPAELLRDVDVHQTGLVRLRDHVDRMRRVLVVLGGERTDLLLGELVRERAQVSLLAGQLERDSACGRLLQDRHPPGSPSRSSL